MPGTEAWVFHFTRFDYSRAFVTAADASAHLHVEFQFYENA
jgi:hypothetical protein